MRVELPGHDIAVPCHEEFSQTPTTSCDYGIDSNGIRHSKFLELLPYFQRKAAPIFALTGPKKLPGTLSAITCARVKKKDEALQLMRGDFDRHSSLFLMFRQNPDLLTLSKEPKYQELMGKIHSRVPETDVLVPPVRMRN